MNTCALKAKTHNVRFRRDEIKGKERMRPETNRGLSQLLLPLRLLLSMSLMNSGLPVSRAFSADAGGRVRWGVVLGDQRDQQGKNFLLENFQDLPKGELVAILDPTRSFSSNESGPENDYDYYYDDDDNNNYDVGTTTTTSPSVYYRRDDFLSDDRIDAVWIDTPPGQHLYYAMHVASIRHSLPDVESPPRFVCVSRPMLGRSYEETATMAAALHARRLVLLPAPLVDLEQRVQWIQESLSEVVGDLQSVTYQYTKSAGCSGDDVNDDSNAAADIHGGAGVWMQNGPLVLRSLEMLLGPLEHVQGQALNRHSPEQDVEDYVWMEAAAGTVDVHAVWDMTQTEMKENHTTTFDCFTLQGSKGRIQIRGLITSPKIEIYRYINDEDIELVAQRDFGHTLSSRAACLAQVTDRISRDMPQVDLKATLRLSAHIDRILSSYYGGRGDDFFARPATWPGIPPERRQLYLDQETGS